MSFQGIAGQNKLAFSNEDFYNRYYITLYQTVPAIKPRTAIVMVDFDFYKWGCRPSLMMLQETRELTRVWISSTNEDYVVERYNGIINAHQGR